MKIILAFDSFKGCLSAADVCAAAAKGIHSVCPDAEMLRDAGFERLRCVNGGDGRLVAELMQPAVAEENVKRMCQRMMEEWQ